MKRKKKCQNKILETGAAVALTTTMVVGSSGLVNSLPMCKKEDACRPEHIEQTNEVVRVVSPSATAMSTGSLQALNLSERISVGDSLITGLQKIANKAKERWNK